MYAARAPHTVRSWECGVSCATRSVVRNCAYGGNLDDAVQGATVVEEQGVVEEQAADGGVLGGGYGEDDADAACAASTAFEEADDGGFPRREGPAVPAAEWICA